MAGDREERWIDSLHEDHNGIVWTTKAELRAALASERETRATALPPQDMTLISGTPENKEWHRAHAAALASPATPEATADAAHQWHESGCPYCTALDPLLIALNDIEHNDMAERDLIVSMARSLWENGYNAGRYEAEVVRP